MTEMLEDLRTYLLTQSSLTALVSTRIYSATPPVGFQLPAVVYSRQFTERLHVNSWMIPEWSFSCLGASHVQAQSVARALIGALEGFHGEMNGRHVRVSIINEYDGNPDPDLGLWPVVVLGRMLYRDV